MDFLVLRPYSVQVTAVNNLQHERLPLVPMEVFHNCLWFKIGRQRIFDNKASEDRNVALCGTTNQKREEKHKLCFRLVSVDPDNRQEHRLDADCEGERACHFHDAICI